jgi:hypothetical protein
LTTRKSSDGAIFAVLLVNTSRPLDAISTKPESQFGIPVSAMAMSDQRAEWLLEQTAKSVLLSSSRQQMLAETTGKPVKHQ